MATCWQRICRVRGHKLSIETDTEITPGSSTDRQEVRRHKDPQKSRVTNGSAFLPGVDGRSPWVRRAKDLIAAYSTDTPDPSAAEHSLIRRASALTVELERLEETFAKAGAADTGDLETYQRCANTLRRLLEAICSGALQRRQRDVTPTLNEIAEEIAAGKRGNATVVG